MKVLHIGLCSIKGGIESFALNYFRELNEKGVRFDFADIYGNGIADEEQIRELGGRILCLPNYKSHPLTVLVKLTRIIKKGDYDAVHINAQTAANIIPALAACLAGITPVIHAHVVNEEGKLRKFLHRLNLRWLRSISAVRVACSQESGEWLWGDKPFQVIPNAVNLTQYAFSQQNRQQIRNLLNIENQTLVLGYVGRLEPVKNPLFAVRLLEQYSKSFPETKTKLLVLGDGSMYDQMLTEIETLGIRDSVIMAGVQKNVAQYLSAMDFFIMPSLHEAISLSAVEAQSNGLCCVFSDTITEQLKILDTAVFLPLEHPEHWITHIHDLARQPNRGRVAATEIVENTSFNIERSAQALLKIYDQLMDINGKTV